jgi:putative PEP-CTERM system histidine kinase
MGLTALPGLLCAAAFAALIVLTLRRDRPGREGAVVLAACAATMLWAVLDAVGGFGQPGLVPLAQGLACLVWLGFLELLLAPHRNLSSRRRGLLVAAAIVGASAVLLEDLVSVGLATSPASLAMPQILGHEALAIVGLLLIENLYRNTEANRLWHVSPLCIGLGGFFAYQLFLYTDALLFGRVDPIFAAAAPVAAMLVAPFLALTLARNRAWRLDIHVSRQVVLHTLTFIASGAFLMAVAVAGLVLRRIGGDWGALIQVSSLFGSVLVLATVLSSGSVKGRLKYLVSRNFFSLRYDYRVEWMSFIDILSSGGAADDLQRRVIRAVANIVDSPAGVLWRLVEGARFVPAAQWNMPLPRAAVEPADGAFVSAFRGGRWTQILTAPEAAAPDGAPWHENGTFWLAVPLVHQDRMLGFIAVAPPRAPLELNWESFDLLRAVGRQAASYLSEERTAQQLNDARRLEELSKRFAFIAHDIKNLTSQLRMIVANAQRHGDNPEFQADVFRTIESSVARMDKMLLQLKVERSLEETGPPFIDPASIVADLVRELGGGAVPVRMLSEVGEARVRIAPERLRSSLTHLINNAIEASAGRGAVTIGVQRAGGKLLIDVRDQGPGMAEAFIHDQLFRPRQSTKEGGYGIGAYQTRELIRSAGGELEVTSAPGEGTVMRIVLPLALEGAVSSAA